MLFVTEGVTIRGVRSVRATGSERAAVVPRT